MLTRRPPCLQLCTSEAKNADRGTGVVLKCLMRKVHEVTEGCAKDLARVVSTALQFYEPVRVSQFHLGSENGGWGSSVYVVPQSAVPY